MVRHIVINPICCFCFILTCICAFGQANHSGFNANNAKSEFLKNYEAHTVIFYQSTAHTPKPVSTLKLAVEKLDTPKFKIKYTWAGLITGLIAGGISGALSKGTQEEKELESLYGMWTGFKYGLVSGFIVDLGMFCIKDYKYKKQQKLKLN